MEKRINIRAADYRFEDKIKYYQGFINSRNQRKEGTKNHELRHLSEVMIDFTEESIQKLYGVHLMVTRVNGSPVVAIQDYRLPPREK